MADGTSAAAERATSSHGGAAREDLTAAHGTIGHLVAGSPFCSYLVDANLRFLYASAGAREFFGYAGELQGQGLYRVLRSIWHERFARQVVARFRHTLKTGEPYVAPRAAEWRHDIPAVLIHDWRIERIVLPGGRAAIVCHLHDVSEQQRLAAALRDTEERLATQLTAVFRLNDLSTRTVPVGDVQTLYEHMLDAAIAVMHSECASLQRLEPDGDGGQVLRLIAHRGFHAASALHWQRVAVGGSTTCGVAFRVRRRFIIVDIEQWHAIKGSADYEEFRRCGIRAVQSTPLFSRTGVLIGMVSTHWNHPYRPTDGELRAFDIVARQVADFLEAQSGAATRSVSA